jgi:hypothetical protein
MPHEIGPRGPYGETWTRSRRQADLVAPRRHPRSAGRADFAERDLKLALALFAVPSSCSSIGRTEFRMRRVLRPEKEPRAPPRR